jgi:hypothetical protein
MQDFTTLPGYTTPRDQGEHVLTVVSVETLAYIALLVLALVLRVAELDTVPLALTETRPALAAWHIVEPHAVGQAPVANSPWLLLLQTASFATLGGSEFSARILTVLGGLALVFSPLLFRNLLGRSRTFLLVALLTFSPVLLLSSRFSSPVVWSVVFAVAALACGLRYLRGAGAAYALLATVLFAGVIFLSEPGGYLLAVVLVLSFLAARWLSPVDDEIIDSEANAEPIDMQRWRAWPWQQGFALAAFIIFLVGTQFMLNQSGLSSIGALLGDGGRGLTVPFPGAPPLYALIISLFYEPFLWLFAAVGLVVIWRRGMTSFIDRFFIAWTVFGVLALLLYVGAAPANALWLTIPLVGLSSRAAVELLRDDERNIWDTPSWARWILALLTLGLLAIASIAGQLVARSMARQPLIAENLVSQLDPIGMILLMMVLMFFVVGFFLATNVWDSGTAGRGLLLGILIFGALTSMGAGWNAAVPNASLAFEPWHLQATTGDAPSLRGTLNDVAKRETRGMHSLPIAVEMADDGIVAWLLRDYTDATLIGAPGDTRGEKVVLLPTAPGNDAPQPDLGGSYVGQDFIVTRTYDLSRLSVGNLLSWYLQRRAPSQSTPLDTVVLYLRQDVYEGTDE